MRPTDIYLIMALATALSACGGSDGSGKSNTTTSGSGDSSQSVVTQSGEILVFGAASLRESLDELGANFEKETGVKVLFNFAGSNDLAHQIIAARGADLYLSAAANWVDTVEKAGRIIAGTRRNLLSNALVVVAHSKSNFTVSAPCALASLPIRNLSLGDPEAVPAGKYAKTWLSSITCNGATLWDALKSDVAPAPDVRSALGLVASDPAIIGIVYNTDLLATKTGVKLLYAIKDGPPIRYVLTQISEGENPDAARRFHEYISGEKGRRVFESYGFTYTPTTATK